MIVIFIEVSIYGFHHASYELRKECLSLKYIYICLSFKYINIYLNAFIEFVTALYYTIQIKDTLLNCVFFSANQ